MNKSWEAKSNTKILPRGGHANAQSQPAAREKRGHRNRAKSTGGTSQPRCVTSGHLSTSGENSRTEFFKSQFLISSLPPSSPSSDSHRTATEGNRLRRGEASDPSTDKSTSVLHISGGTLEESSQGCKLWSCYHFPMFKKKKKPVSYIIQVANLL